MATDRASGKNHVGILVGGGPAPGINGVISASPSKRARALVKSSASTTAFSG